MIQCVQLAFGDSECGGDHRRGAAAAAADEQPTADVNDWPSGITDTLIAVAPSGLRRSVSVRELETYFVPAFHREVSLWWSNGFGNADCIRCVEMLSGAIFSPFRKNSASSRFAEAFLKHEFANRIAE